MTSKGQKQNLNWTMDRIEYESYRVFSSAHKKSLFNPKYSGHNISITIGMPTRNKLLSKRADQQATAPERVRLADGGQCGF